MTRAHREAARTRSKILFLTSLLLALGACKDAPAQAHDNGEAPRDKSSSDEAPKRRSNELLLTRDALEADGVTLGKPLARVFDAAVYTKLGELADAPSAKRSLTIHVTRDAEFGSLFDLSSNVNQGRDSAKLISLSTAVEGAAPGVYPLPSRKPDKEPVVRIVVDSAGFFVELSGNRAAPGCEVTGSGVTIPRKDSKLDVEGLKRCIGTIKSQGAVTDATASIGSSPLGSAAEVVETATSLLQSDVVPVVWVDLFECSERSCASRSFRDEGLIGLGNSEKTDPLQPAASGSAASGNAAITGANVAGGSIANASAVVAAMAPGFRRCYNKGLAEDPNMKGSLRVTAKIGPKGDVVSATPGGGVGLSKTVTDCVVARVSSAQFAEPEGGGATIVIPVSFYPQ
ncbi:MAG: AgmX/PglI C-terminal domain-containing protein [Polyangiaceae bacterium]